MHLAPLFNESAAQLDANLEAIITAADLTQATAATAQTLTLFTIKAPYTSVQLIRAELLEPFEDPADAANNTTAVEVGDAGDTDRLLAAMQLNKNGTEVYNKTGTGAVYVPTADTPLTVTFAAPAEAKTLAALKKGRLRLLFQRYDSRDAR